MTGEGGEGSEAGCLAGSAQGELEGKGGKNERGRYGRGR